MRRTVWTVYGLLGIWLVASIGCGSFMELPGASPDDETVQNIDAVSTPAPADFSKGSEIASLQNAAQWQQPLMPAFEQAAAQYNVPIDLLITLAKIGSGLENRGQAKTIEGGYGLMALRKNDLGGNSLELAAQLTGKSPEELIADPAASIYGAAAVLSADADKAQIDREAGLEAWLPAVIAYAGLDEEDSKFFAYGVYELLGVGFDTTNSTGESFRVAPHDFSAMNLDSLIPPGMKRIAIEDLEAGINPDTIGSPDKSDTLKVDYPSAIWDPAASCNYSTSITGKDTIIIHTIEGSAAGSRSWFKNCAANSSAHYVVSEAGTVWQMVEERYVAWHVGCLNSRSIGIENEGYAGSSSHPTSLYNATGALCRNICDRRGIVKAHRTCAPGILGHNDANNCHCGGSHWDPGSGWNWSYFIGVVNGSSCNINMTQGAIRAKYESIGGCGSVLGAPTTYELTCPDNVGKYNHFQNGSIYWTNTLGAHVIRGDIRTKWSQMGWETSAHGYPTTDELVCPDNVGHYNHFQNGSIYWTQSLGAKSIRGAIHTKWAALGWETGPNGYPTTDESTCPDNVGKYNHFQNGSIYYTPTLGASSVRGAIHTKWAALGWENGPNGYPTTDELTCPDNVGKYNHFQNGSIYYTPATGACSVRGSIHAKWVELGWENGPNGYPTNDESPCADGVGRYNTFQNGAIYYSPASGTHSVVGAIYAKWQSMNYENGALGYPTSDEYDYNGGRRSDFEDGYIIWTSAGGAVAYVNGDTTAPSVPGTPAATAASTTQINLSWTASTDNVGVTGYKIYRNGALLTTVTGTTYSNTGLTMGATYTYRVSAIDAAGNESAQSGQKDETTWIIVDNVDAGFSASTIWTTGTYATDKYGTNYRFRSTEAVSDVATWTFTIPTADTYEVYVWWSQGTNRSAAAPYSVNGGGSITRNQQTGGGAWNSLGTFSMGAGSNNVRLSCWAATGYVVIADAVRIVRR